MYNEFKAKTVDLNTLANQPEEWVWMSFTDAYSVPAKDVAELQLIGLKRRFDEMRAQVRHQRVGRHIDGVADLDARAAYSTFNMGAGYALYCAGGEGEAVVRTAQSLGLDALLTRALDASGYRALLLEGLVG